MTEERVKEIIKSYAYGMTTDQVSDVEEMSTEEVKAFAAEYAAEIEAKKEELRGGGWIE